LKTRRLERLPTIGVKMPKLRGRGFAVSLICNGEQSESQSLPMTAVHANMSIKRTVIGLQALGGKDACMALME
jgi:hypothetical protein